MWFIFNQYMPGKNKSLVKSDFVDSVLCSFGLRKFLFGCAKPKRIKLPAQKWLSRSSAFSLNSIISGLFLHYFENLLLFLALLIFFVCLLSFYVFPSLDYIFHSAPFCFTSLLYCQFLKSAISRLEILHFSNIDCLIMSIFLMSHFIWNSRMLLNSQKWCYYQIAFVIPRSLLYLNIYRIIYCRVLYFDTCMKEIVLGEKVFKYRLYYQFLGVRYAQV